MNTSSNKGFSILEAIVAIAILGILVLGVLEIVKMTTSIQAMANANLQADDQTFQVRAVLRNPAACSLNLAGLSVNATSKTPVSDIKYLAPDQISLTSNSAIATSSSNSIQIGSMMISRDPNIPEIAILTLPFESKLKIGSAILRKVQLEIQVDSSGKIVKCSSDRISDAENLAGGNLPKSILRNCEPNSRAGISGGPGLNPAQLKAAVRKRINHICDNLNYPTGNQGSPLSFKAPPLPYDPSEVTGASIAYLSSDNPTIFLKMVPGNPKPTLYAGKYFSNLTSSEECKATPEFPSGAGTSTKSFLGQVDSSTVYTENREVCIDGAWVPTTGNTSSENISNG